MGRTIGNVTSRNIVDGLAPSTAAASNRSRGTRVRAANMLRAMNGYGLPHDHGRDDAVGRNRTGEPVVAIEARKTQSDEDVIDNSPLGLEQPLPDGGSGDAVGIAHASNMATVITTRRGLPTRFMSRATPVPSSHCEPDDGEYEEDGLLERVEELLPVNSSL